MLCSLVGTNKLSVREIKNGSMKGYTIVIVKDPYTGCDDVQEALRNILPPDSKTFVQRFTAA